MAIPHDKSRIIITLPEKMKSDIEFLSLNDKRTPSKEIEYIIEQYLKEVENRFSDEDFYDHYENYYKPKQLADKIVTLLSLKNNKDVNISLFVNLNDITDKVIDLVRFNRKITDESFERFLKYIKTDKKD